jgi:hypothetical protein
MKKSRYTEEQMRSSSASLGTRATGNRSSPRQCRMSCLSNLSASNRSVLERCARRFTLMTDESIKG